MMRILAMVVIAWAIQSPWPAVGAPARPLVFIPGILGSILVDGNNNIVWGDANSLGRLNQLTIQDGPQDPADSLRPSGIIQQVLVFGFWKIKQYDGLNRSLAD